jgi:MFS family permease
LKPIHLTYAIALAGFTLVTAGRVMLQLYALELGATPGEVGVLFSTYFIFPLLISFPLGLLADRVSSRGLLALGMAFGAGGMLVPALVEGMPALYFAGVMIGITFAFTSVLIQNITGLLSRPDERARNFSNASLVGASTLMLGPLVAGFGIDLVGHAGACLSSVALGVVAIAMLARWGGLFPKPGSRPRRPGSAASASTGRLAAAWTSLRESLADRKSLPIIVVGSILHFGQDLYQFYLPVYAHDLGLSASVIGIILASVFIMSVVVRAWLPMLVKRLGEERLLIMAFVLGAVGFACTPLLANPVALCLLAGLFGMGMGVGSPVIMMLIFAHAPEGRSGEMVGMRNTANNLGRAGAPPLFGFIASAAGLMPVFAISAAMMVGGAWIMNRQLRRLAVAK